MRKFGSVVGVLVIALGLASCSNRALGPGEARLKITSGKAQVAPLGEGYKSAHSDQRLHKGERVRVTQGLAQVEFSNSRSLELQTGSEVTVLATPELLSGDVLATAKDSQLVVNAGNAEARVRRGAAHVTRGLAATAASYSGDLVLSSAGRDLTVPALRQAAVAAPGLVPVTPTPLDYRSENPWDRRYLGDAIELGDELQARSQGFTAQLDGTEGHTPGFYRQLIPALESEPSLDRLLDPGSSPGDTLVGAAITVQGKDGNFTDRWQSVFSFHGQGARWGLVALDQHVSRGPLLSQVDEALGRRTVGTPNLAAPAAGQAPGLNLGVSQSNATGAPNNAGPSGPAPSGGGGGGGASPPTTAPLLPGPAPTVPPGILQPLLPSPQPTPPGQPAPSPTQPVEGLVQGVGGLVGGLLGGLLSPRS